MDINKLIKQSISTEQQFCEGAFIASQHGSYFFGFNYAVAKVKKQFSHSGSNQLDRINAFDTAEITSAHLGQINAMTVSSFCGPKGIIWGYDVCRAPKQVNPWGITEHDLGQPGLDVWDMRPLVDAYTQLTGTVGNPHFPFYPGSHIPTAMKSITREGVCTLYVAHGCGIPVNRDRNACALMEDIGIIPDAIGQRDEYIRGMLIKLCQSILRIGINQQVQYESILIGFNHIDVEEDEVGCALAASPYFTLAQAALPAEKRLDNLTVKQWQAIVSDNYLCHSQAVTEASLCEA